MILINPNITDLSAGYALVVAFIATLESTWLPGFDRSYERRINEYQVALEKHENRGLFLRTLLRKPKRPNRLPPGYKKDVTTRLYAAWIESFTAVPPTPLDDTLQLLQESLDNSFIAVTHLQLQANLSAPIVVLGPPGIILAAGSLSRQPYQLPAEQLLQQSAIAMREQLQLTDFVDVPIHAGHPEYWQQNLAEITLNETLDGQKVFALTDTLLARQQELSKARTFSALPTAEKLMEQEKENLLRMAATL